VFTGALSSREFCFSGWQLLLRCCWYSSVYNLLGTGAGLWWR